jgi:hypothetical protein
MQRQTGWVAILGVVLCFGRPVLAFGPPGSPSDQSIVTDIEAKLFQDPVLKRRNIHVSAQGGVVTLTGSVRSREEKRAAERIASYEPGVKQVIDSMSPSEPASPEEAPSRSLHPAVFTVPAGTIITVRMIDSVDSRRHHPGDEFDATVDAPVAAGNRVAIPKNSTARVRLVNASNAGHMRGSSALQLELVSLTVRGITYNVESGYYEQHGPSRGRRTAETVGGGAAIGALIGALARGRTGAAIGAGAGAATGAGVQAVTKGAAVRVPAETKLDFTLRTPVTITAGS